MSRLKKLINKDPIHGRVIDLKTYEADENLVVVEGKLMDTRYRDVYDLTGEKQSQGPIHHLVVRLLIRADSMKIEDAEAELLHAPHEECLSAFENINDIIGLEIKGGFTKKLMGKIGGAEGCSHLSHLLTVMSQEVFQGVTVHRRKHKKPVPKTLNEIPNLEYLIDSCKMWKKGGVKLTRMKKAVNN